MMAPARCSITRLVMTALLALAPSNAMAGSVGAGQAQTPGSANFATWLSGEVESFVISEFSGPGVTIKSVSSNIPALYHPPEEFDSIDISVPPQNRNGAKMFALVSFIENGRVVSRVNVMVSVKGERDVVFAGRDIRRGAIIGAEDVQTRRADVNILDKYIISDPAGVMGKEAQRSVKAGMALRRQYFSSPKMVKAGDTVTVVARSGGMKITLTGKARQGGDRGEWIKVINPLSKKIINARVTAPGEATVEF